MIERDGKGEFIAAATAGMGDSVCGGCRQHEATVASIGAKDLEATAQFEEDLQSLQASIDAEFGKDSDHSCKKFFSPSLSDCQLY